MFATAPEPKPATGDFQVLVLAKQLIVQLLLMLCTVF